MFNRFVISALLAVGVAGTAQADNAAADEVQPVVASTAPRASILHDDMQKASLRSVNVEEDLKRTEQRLQTELIDALATIAQISDK